MSKEFKNKNLNRDRINDCLRDIGVEQFSYQVKNQSGLHHLRGVYQGSNFLLNVFENKDGTTSLGFSSGQDRDLFDLLAEEIVRCCSYSEESKLELSLPKFSAEGLNNLLEYLYSEGASLREEKQLPYGGYSANCKAQRGTH